MITDEQRALVIDNPKKVKAGLDKSGGLYAGLVNVECDNGITKTVARTGFEFTSKKAATDRAKEMIEAIKNGEEIHKVTKIAEEPPADEDEGEGEGDEGEGGEE